MNNDDYIAFKLGTALALLFGANVLSGACAAETTATRIPVKPNIVFLLADDMGYGDLGCFGSSVIQSPNLDKLAGQGVKLNQCYAASPNCSPSRTGMLTGRSPYRVGMYDFARFKPLHIPVEEVPPSHRRSIAMLSPVTMQNLMPCTSSTSPEQSRMPSNPSGHR